MSGALPTDSYFLDRFSPSRYSTKKGARRAPLEFSKTDAFMTIKSEHKLLAREAKAIVALAFRNGPIEAIHAGANCPACTGQSGYSRITQAEMKSIMKNAVDRLYYLLCLKAENPIDYETQIQFGERYTVRWDEPKMPERPLIS
jgi:hypothetical protein